MVARVWVDINGTDRIAEWHKRHTGEAIRFENLSGAKRRRATMDDSNTEEERTPKVARMLIDTTSDELNSPQQKSPQISDSSLGPTGKLKIRLEFTPSCCHLPMSAQAAGKPNAKCGLHR